MNLFKKYIFVICLFLFTFFSSYSQVTLNDMIKIHSMNIDEFETFCLKNNFEINEIIDTGLISGITYVKGFGNETRYIHFYKKYIRLDKRISYETSDNNEILTFKKNLNDLGFKIIESDFYKNQNGDNRKKTVYRNQSFEVTIILIPSSDGKFSGVYNIGLNKIQNKD